jgi:tetratricopeptide (TPR) repeat protein
MTYRPAFEIPPLPPNFAGGLLAMIAPISLLYIYYSWRKRDLQMVIISGIMGFLILTALILTSSRGAFLALLTGAGIWFVWRGSLYLARKSKRSVSLIFLIIISMIAILTVWFVLGYPGGLIALFDRLPGLASGESRLDLATSAGKLIEDYPFTGGGLRSFPGLFSQYIMVTPYFLFAYSHNFYLDIILEQGFLRQILVDREDHQLKILGEAVFIGLIVILVHGLVDDALYGDLGTPLLLLLPGIAVMLVRSWQPADATAEQPENAIKTVRDFVSMRKGLFFGGATFVIIVITFFIYQKQLLASWYANIGAVEMSRWELAGWPFDKWNADPDVSPIASAETMFSKSLSFNANQRTSRHRQGLIAMQRRDFGTASEELERAYELDREHRGIRKSLGYAYVWDGKLDEAQMLLQEINEAEYEMGVYSWWWQELDRRDLAGQAREMETILHAHNRFIQE